MIRNKQIGRKRKAAYAVATMKAGAGTRSFPLVVPPTPQVTTCTNTTSFVVAAATPHSSPSVTLHDAPTQLATSTSTSVVRHFPTSVLLKEQRDDSRSYPPCRKSPTKVKLDRQELDDGLPVSEDKYNEYLRYIELHMLYRPGFWYLFPPCIEEAQYSSKLVEYLPTAKDRLVEQSCNMDNSGGNWPLDALALAKRAMLATHEVAKLVDSSYILGANSNNLRTSSLVAGKSVVLGKPVIRSRRLLQRQPKKRKESKSQTTFLPDVSRSVEISKKLTDGLNSNDPLRLFLGDPETKKLLTVKQERDIFCKIQDLMRAEEVKKVLHKQFLRDPTLAEWAEAVGMNCRDLQSCVRSGNSCREKMIYANFRLVVHVAKKYKGKGLDLQDLLQVGSMGLMKSLQKFKPKAGCRFSTYAYWWIRLSIKKAIFQNSRTIRLPENIFGLLKQIKNVRRLYIQEGHYPNNEDLAKHFGITVEKLERLLITTRAPVSIQDSAWTDQNITFQEITADPEVETPDLFIAKQMMRHHAHNLLRILPPRERHIIWLRYGIDGGRQKTLTDIGDLYGVSKERIRQLESRALDKLKDCLNSQGLEDYVNLLI